MRLQAVVYLHFHCCLSNLMSVTVRRFLHYHFLSVVPQILALVIPRKHNYTNTMLMKKQTNYY